MRKYDVHQIYFFFLFSNILNTNIEFPVWQYIHWLCITERVLLTHKQQIQILNWRKKQWSAANTKAVLFYQFFCKTNRWGAWSLDKLKIIVAGWLFGLVVRRQPGHLILNSNKYPHSLVPCTYPQVLKRVKTGSFASSSHGKQKIRKLATFVLPF